MAKRDGTRALTDAQWKRLAPLIEAVRPRGKTAHHDLRRTIAAIVWRHRNGPPCRTIPAELGPWWMAAQTFHRWAASASGSGCWSWRKNAVSSWAWRSWTAPASARTRR